MAVIQRAGEEEGRLPVRVDAMTLQDIPEVMAVERASFTVPWPSSAYRRELTENRNARYIVLRLPGVEPQAPPSLHSTERRGFLQSLLPRGRRPEAEEIQTVSLAGYAGLWLVIDEAHVTTLAVRPEHRRRGFGELLLVQLYDTALEMNARWLTLEVRLSNTSAQELYRKYGFRDAGTRRRYYSDNNEDALIMWTDEIDKPAVARRYRALRRALFDRLEGDGEIFAPRSRDLTAVDPGPVDSSDQSR